MARALLRRGLGSLMAPTVAQQATVAVSDPYGGALQALADLTAALSTSKPKEPVVSDQMPAPTAFKFSRNLGQRRAIDIDESSGESDYETFAPQSIAGAGTSDASGSLGTLKTLGRTFSEEAWLFGDDVESDTPSGEAGTASGSGAALESSPAASTDLAPSDRTREKSAQLSATASSVPEDVAPSATKNNPRQAEVTAERAQHRPSDGGLATAPHAAGTQSASTPRVPAAPFVTSPATASSRTAPESADVGVDENASLDNQVQGLIQLEKLARAWAGSQNQSALLGNVLETKGPSLAQRKRVVARAAERRDAVQSQDAVSSSAKASHAFPSGSAGSKDPAKPGDVTSEVPSPRYAERCQPQKEISTMLPRPAADSQTVASAPTEEHSERGDHWCSGVAASWAEGWQAAQHHDVGRVLEQAPQHVLPANVEHDPQALAWQQRGWPKAQSVLTITSGSLPAEQCSAQHQGVMASEVQGWVPEAWQPVPQGVEGGVKRSLDLRPQFRNGGTLKRITAGGLCAGWENNGAPAGAVGALGVADAPASAPVAQAIMVESPAAEHHNEDEAVLMADGTSTSSNWGIPPAPPGKVVLRPTAKTAPGISWAKGMMAPLPRSASTEGTGGPEQTGQTPLKEAVHLRSQPKARGSSDKVHGPAPPACPPPHSALLTHAQDTAGEEDRLPVDAECPVPVGDWIGSVDPGHQVMETDSGSVHRENADIEDAIPVDCDAEDSADAKDGVQSQSNPDVEGFVKAVRAKAKSMKRKAVKETPANASKKIGPARRPVIGPIRPMGDRGGQKREFTVVVRFAGPEENPSDNLYVAGLPTDLVEDAPKMQLVFEKLGYKVARTRHFGDSKGYGFCSGMVQMQSVEEAAAAISELHEMGSDKFAEAFHKKRLQSLRARIPSLGEEVVVNRSDAGTKRTWIQPRIPRSTRARQGNV